MKLRLPTWLSFCVLALGCTNDPGARTTGGGPPTVRSCESLSNPPAACGDNCPGGSDAECGAGTFCANRRCVAMCAQASDCGADFECTAQGRCMAIIPELDGGPEPDSGSCIDVALSPARQIPDIVFLVDRSGSMAEAFGCGNANNCSRWNEARDAILELIEPLQANVRFGIATYSDGANCPTVDFEPPALDNYTNLRDTYPNSPGGNTPTGESLDNLRMSLDTLNVGTMPHSTTVILATDGLPDTCAIRNPANDAQQLEFNRLTVEAGARMYAAGYELLILSVGQGVISEEHLQDMANVGQGLPRATRGAGAASFSTAANPAQLSAAIAALVGERISCDIDLGQSVQELSRVCEGNVRMNGTPLTCGSQWRLKPGTNDTIELLGATCDTWRNTDSSLSATFPCGVLVVE